MGLLARLFSPNIDKLEAKGDVARLRAIYEKRKSRRAVEGEQIIAQSKCAIALARLGDPAGVTKVLGLALANDQDSVPPPGVTESSYTLLRYKAGFNSRTTMGPTGDVPIDALRRLGDAAVPEVFQWASGFVFGLLSSNATLRETMQRHLESSREAALGTMLKAVGPLVLFAFADEPEVASRARALILELGEQALPALVGECKRTSGFIKTRINDLRKQDKDPARDLNDFDRAQRFLCMDYLRGTALLFPADAETVDFLTTLKEHPDAGIRLTAMLLAPVAIRSDLVQRCWTCGTDLGGHAGVALVDSQPPRWLLKTLLLLDGIPELCAGCNDRIKPLLAAAEVA
jgi:hypothetical protein